MAEQYANNAQTTLNGAINNSTTSITVTDGSVFPSSGDFRLKIGTELLLCTARSGNTLTVTRGVESSAADSHADLAPVKHVLTKQGFLNLVGDAIQIGARASRPSAPNKGTLYYPNDYGLLSYYDGSAWNYLLDGRVVTPPAVSDFAWTNQGSATAVDRDGIVMTAPDSSGDSIRILSKAKAGSTYTVTAMFRGLHPSDNYYGYGLCLVDSASGKLITFKSGTTGSIAVENWNSPTSFLNTASPISGNINTQRNSLIHLRIIQNGTNRLYQASVNGYDWITTHSTTNSNFIGETHVGLIVHTNRSGASASVIQMYCPHFVSV